MVRMEAKGMVLNLLLLGHDQSSFTLNGFDSSRMCRELVATVRWEIIYKQILEGWNSIRSMLIVPLLQSAVTICLIMVVMILLERLFVGAVCLAVKMIKLKPEKRYKWEPIETDEVWGSSVYPMVLVQIPMYNEKEVHKFSIGAAWALEWPSDRLTIQVLDDSTDKLCKEMVELECQTWKTKGVNVMHVVRNDRTGSKAGALNEGLQHDFVKECEYVAIFDAGFQPEPDFLSRTVPFLVHNSDVALVQARWKFGNADECLMTRFQEMSLDYHFKFEQEYGSSLFGFIGFKLSMLYTVSGAAGVWRTEAILDAGGWMDRTTVEDMDLSVRASLKGWKFVYVGDIEVKNELPSTFKAYRHQQYRRSRGSTNLFKKMALEIIQNKKVSFWKKVHLLYSFFFLREFVAHTVTFIFYCVLIPLAVLFPEVVIPFWGAVYVPAVILFCKCMGTPSSIHLFVTWVLFENAMSLHRLKAAITGLFEAEQVDDRITTEKDGDINTSKPVVVDMMEADKLVESQLTEPCIPKSKICRFYHSELVFRTFLLFCGYYDIAFSKKGYFIYLIAQSAAFFVVGFGYVGTPALS